MLLEKIRQRPDKRLEALPGRSPRPKRWRPAQDRVLQLTVGLIQQGHGQARAISEPPIDGPLSDAGRLGDLIHRHTVGAVLVEERRCGVEDRLPIAGGVRALARRGSGIEGCEPGGHL